MKINVNILKEHPLNKQIYGDEDEPQFNALVEKIKSSGWIKTIIVTKDDVIISGHRRVKAAIALGIEAVECEIVDNDEEKQLEIFLNENAYRQKSTFQLLKESELYFEIEKKKAYQREIAGVNPGSNLTQGRTNEIVAEKIGMSTSSYKKGRKILKRIEEEPDPRIEWFFENTVNQSIDAASKLVEKPIEFLQSVIDKTEGDEMKISSAIKEVTLAELRQKSSLPPGKYQIIYFDMTNKDVQNLNHTIITDICEDNCILFAWVKTHQLPQGMKLCEQWGFRYANCLVWNLDVLNEVSENGEILLVYVKGSPKLIFDISTRSEQKPSMVKEIIEKGYPGWSRVEIFKGDGCEIW
jgi:N6-adenosine-specific RNA methylase IME4